MEVPAKLPYGLDSQAYAQNSFLIPDNDQGRRSGVQLPEGVELMQVDLE